MSRGCTRGCGDSNTRPATTVRRAFDPVAGGQKRVKALNKGWVSREEVRYALYDARSVDAKVEKRCEQALDCI